MAGPVLYSTNTWFAYDIATRYRNGVHFVWCSEYYDPSVAPAGSYTAAVAPSSNPRQIYDTLHGDVVREDMHSALIGGYKKTFRRLTKAWLADGSITQAQFDEINTTIKLPSWKIWRPVLYVISYELVKDRIVSVPHKSRAGYGPEMQIPDLRSNEFDVIER